MKMDKDSTNVFLKYQPNKITTSSITSSIRYNKVNSLINPSNGFILGADLTAAGIGGDSQYFKGILTGKMFKPISSNDIIFKLVGKFSHIHGIGNKNVMIKDSFFSNESLRGFGFDGIGAKIKIRKLLVVIFNIH